MKESSFVCTRCGRQSFGAPAVKGPKKRVCQLCVNAEQEQVRKRTRERMREMRRRDRESRDGDGRTRICEKCGESQFIYSFRKMGRGRSRWCLPCEGRFERYCSSSKRKTEGVVDSGDMCAEMAERQRKTQEEKQKRRKKP
ncbi:MAG: hypothetical protein DRJ03_12075 [Chloroflexi bacterium]|nr:MAG: hypothetical protein DRJ03_12075 [Chloroflexota bacterium]